MVTDDTISDALGLNGSKCLKKHQKNFIMDDYDDEMFQQKSKEENEIDGISTILSLLFCEGKETTYIAQLLSNRSNKVRKKVIIYV